jgi:bifunctional DNA-binding transcriptional regulator/antitoxin component of YhaV-PrlF toxin-antitoxin module
MLFTHSQFRPQSGVTRRIWEIADDLTVNFGRQATRRAVLERAADEGIHQGTASKQYNDWRVAYSSGRSGFDEAPVAPLHLHLQISADGRILIPVEMRRAMKIDESGKVNAELVGGELRLFSPAVALEKLQNLFAPLREAPSLVDELLAERRAEAARE